MTERSELLESYYEELEDSFDFETRSKDLFERFVPTIIGSN